MGQLVSNPVSIIVRLCGMGSPPLPNFFWQNISNWTTKQQKDAKRNSPQVMYIPCDRYHAMSIRYVWFDTSISITFWSNQLKIMTSPCFFHLAQHLQNLRKTRRVSSILDPQFHHFNQGAIEFPIAPLSGDCSLDLFHRAVDKGQTPLLSALCHPPGDPRRPPLETPGRPRDDWRLVNVRGYPAFSGLKRWRLRI